ncbi:MAG: hypothetical protein DDT31_01040 [Syntrophomonadaceae bacterium]|nr:hypothetical protein [Bacillota bacterium]
MSLKSIPYIGEFLPSYEYPAPVRAARILVGALSTVGNDVVVNAIATFNILTVPVNAVVISVHTRIITAFTAAVTLTIGDGVAPALYLASAAIAPQTAVATGSLVGSANVSKHYLAGTNITITAAGAVPTAGQMEVFIVYALAGND